jgi:hypothetical protein
MAKPTLPSPGQLVSELVEEAAGFAKDVRKSGEVHAQDYDIIAKQEVAFFEALISEVPKGSAIPHSVYAIVGSLLHHEHNVPGVGSDFLLL